MSLMEKDPAIGSAIRREGRRQFLTINLIASENYASEAVLEAQGSYLTNKYAEGYPGRRFYGGCEEIDEVERLAIERAKKLFGAEYANVQPHSGTQANMASYFALLKPGDRILAMARASGGHLTHGTPVNFSGWLFDFSFYEVDRETEMINYDEVLRIAKETRPKLIVAGASAYPRIIEFGKLKEIADEVGAKLMVDMAHIAGLIAAKLHPDPVPFADVITSSTHKTLRGPRGGFILAKEKYSGDIDRAIFPGTQGGPLMHVIAAKAVAFKEAMGEDFKEYQRNVIKNAKTLAEEIKKGGIRLVSGGTDNHMLLLDLRSLGITGKEAEEALSEAGIIVNKNSIPFDPSPPAYASGIRIGTPAVTSRGMGEGEMKIIAEMLLKVLLNIKNRDLRKKVRKEVEELAGSFPAPGLKSDIMVRGGDAG